jgi:hypothetical protein
MTNLIDLITPTNLIEEHDKFFASSTYSPIFHYTWQDKMPDPQFSSQSRRSLWLAILHQDSREIIQAASHFFEVNITEALTDKALKVAKQRVAASSGSAKQLQQLFLDTFKKFDLDYQPLIVPESGFNMRPRHKDKKLLISEHIQFEYFSMEAEIRHEMVHIVRYINGKHNKIEKSSRYLPTDEGLATWCQDHVGGDGSPAQHAMEYVGSSVGIGKGLREIYECFRAMGMNQELAWQRSSRHKFGFVDTSQPGDILKPAMYYANAEKIDQLTQNERLRLFVGKISLHELDEYSKYDGFWSDQKLIQFFKL